MYKSFGLYGNIFTDAGYLDVDIFGGWHYSFVTLTLFSLTLIKLRVNLLLCNYLTDTVGINQLLFAFIQPSVKNQNLTFTLYLTPLTREYYSSMYSHVVFHK